MVRIKSSKKDASENALENGAEKPFRGEGDDTSAFASKGDDATFIRVTRLDDKDKKWVLHGRLLPSESSNEDVAGLFGGGTYRLTAFTRDPKTGKYDYDGQRQFVIPGTYKPPMGQLPGIGASNNAAQSVPPSKQAAAQAASSGMFDGGTARAVLDASMVETFLSMTRAVKEVAERKPQSDGALEMLVKMQAEQLKAQNDLMGKMLERDSNAKAEAVKLQLAAVERKLAEVIARPETPAVAPSTNALKEAIGMVKELLDVKDMLSGEGGGGGDPLVGLAGKVFDVLNRQPGAGAVPAQPQPQPIPPNMPIWQRLLLANGKALIAAAMRGEDGANVAEAIMTLHFPEQVVGSVTELLKLPNADALVMQTLPPLQEFAAFVQAFVGQMRQALIAPPEGEPLSAEVVEDEDDDPQGGG